MTLLKVSSYVLCRYPGSIAKFRMLRHDLVPENPELAEMAERSRSRQLDGDGVHTVEYELESVEYLALYTSIKIRLRPPTVKVNRGFYGNWRKKTVYIKWRSLPLALGF